MKTLCGNQKWGRLSLSITLSLVLSACGQPEGQHQWRDHGPQNAQDVGLILKGVSKNQVKKWADNNPDVQIREVSPMHQIYEVFQSSRPQLEEDFPEALIYQNEFYPLDNSKENKLNSIEKFTQGDANSSPMPENSLATCVRNAQFSPIAKITPMFPTYNLKQGTIELGTVVSLSALGSGPNEITGGPVKKTWAVIPPTNSEHGIMYLEKDVLTFKPDTLGIYQLALVVQDKNKICSLAPMNFVVTSNPLYKGTIPKFNEFKAKHNLNLFAHMAEIQAQESWTYSQGQGITIAIIDTGVNYNHPALANNIAVNTKEIPENGIDDDGNGIPDDYIGLDFANRDVYPFDDQGHGSHVAGLAASPIFGLAPRAKILPIKALGPAGGDPASVAAAVYYAVDRGAHVINLSLGGEANPHPLMISALTYAESRGIPVIAAAGNGDRKTGLPINIDQKAIYPAALPNKNIISVAAKDSVGLLAPYSNYGVRSVDVVAPGGGVTPGDQIYSCTTINPQNRLYVGHQGTSMAAPIVAGIVGLMRSLNPRLSPQQIKSLLMGSGRQIKGLDQMVRSGRYLNALEALSKTAFTLNFN